ncbi:MAG TPA: hypothetical protein VJ160_01720 [Anaerolineales bacterium]|nr:hypothetical protein [Anaerolineales bacterium]
MDDEKSDGDLARRSARVYAPLALGAGALFYLAAGWTGDLGPVARLGGSVWVAILSLIVSMPLVTARFKRRSRR